MLRPKTKINTILAALVEGLARYSPTLFGDPEQIVTGISMNSKTVEPGDLYVAVAGARHHGADYIPQARQVGAAAVLTDDSGISRIPAEVPHIVVDDLRTALADASAVFYGNTDSVMQQVNDVNCTNG